MVILPSPKLPVDVGRHQGFPCHCLDASPSKLCDAGRDLLRLLCGTVEVARFFSGQPPTVACSVNDESRLDSVLD